MKILSLFWELCKEAVAERPLHIVQQAKWDPKAKVYVVGDLSTPEGPSDPNDPRNRTVDMGAIPPNWHQCFYYYEVLNVEDQPSSGYHYNRCRNLAGPGLKPSFCLLHANQELVKHRHTEAVKRQTLVDDDFSHFCRHGACIVQVWGADRAYCTEHAAPYEPGTTTLKVTKSALLLEEEDCGCYGYCDKHFNNGQPRTQEDIDWDNIVEDVDWTYVNKIGWGHLSYRQNRKTIPVQAQETVHFKLELRGSRDEIDLFHAIIHQADGDYPLDPFRKNTANPEICKNCGGYVWKNAIVTPVDLKKGARQAGITVKVRHYFPESTCKKKDRAANA